jgi:DNA-binding winged helix-turn-helix (wHTH) protein/tetratricopeptide (TPR) repeat protein
MSGHIYRFGDYRVDPASRELWRGDRLVDLPPHVFDCLTYLLERHDRAVGRDELVAAVWGKTEISDTLLGQTVLRIRRELGDDAKDQRILRTIPRFGYRWVAIFDVQEAAPVVAPAAPIPLVATAGNESPGATRAAAVAQKENALPSRWRVAVGLVAAAVLSGFGIWAVQHHRAPAPLPPGDKGLLSAVLPAAVEPGPESDWMRLGIMDVVASRLRTSGLPSVPSESVVAFLNVAPANRNGTVREATAAGLLVSPYVRHVDTRWQVELDADDGAGQHFTSQGQARDAVEAARDAADKLLVALGRQPAGTTAEAPYEILIKRVDAAVLADNPDVARALIAQASAEAQQSPELRLRLAKLDFRAGRLDAARQRLAGLLDEAPAKTAPVLRASVLNGLGAVAVREDRPQQAGQAFSEAIDLLESHPEPAQLGQAYLGRAAAAADQRHFDAAAADYARARIALRQANDTLALVRVAANEGFLDMDQGRPAQALPQLITATEGFKQWGALNEAVLTYIGQISCYLALLDGRSAMQAADDAATVAQRVENPSALDSLTIARARALARVGRLRESRESLDHLRSTSTDAISVAAGGVVLARLDLDSSNVSAAGDLAERSVAVLDAPGYAAMRADAWLTQIRAALNASDSTRAADSVSAFEIWAAQADDLRAPLFASLARAEYARHFGDGDAWRGAFDTARELAARNAVPAEIAAVAKSYADALFGDGDLVAAAVEVGRVSRWSEQDFVCAVLEARLYAALGRNEARQTALARARALAGERSIPADALAVPVSTGAASAQ